MVFSIRESGRPRGSRATEDSGLSPVSNKRLTSDRAVGSIPLDICVSTYIDCSHVIYARARLLV